MEDELLDLADFEDTFTFRYVEAGWGFDLPLGCFLTDVPENDWLLVVVFDGYQAKVKLIWEVKNGSAAHSSDGDDELLAFGDDHEVVGVVALGLWEELYNVRYLHSRGNFARKHINVLAGVFAGQFVLGGSHG